MKKIFLALCLAALSLQAAPPQLFEDGQTLVINNRILTKVNGKPISVMDVVRKMDLIFYRQYPELASNEAARYQFYASGWQSMLGALIDDYLIVADAEEKKVAVTEGEVREELESLFGPDVVMNLDKLGLTLDEAFEMLKTELTVQRMTMAMVRSKAVIEVHPKQVRTFYDEKLAQSPPQNSWTYQMLSIRGEGHERVAQEAHQLLNEQKIPFEEVLATLSESTLELSISEDYSRTEGEMSLAHRAILQTLSAGAFSAPISSDSVSRIFALKEFQKGEAPGFNSVADTLKQELTQKAIARHNDIYRERLRERFGVTEKYLSEAIPQSFEPFALR